MRYQVGDELYYRHSAGIEEGPVRVIEVLELLGFGMWDYRVLNIGGEANAAGIVAEHELEPLTSVGALKAGSR
jgi:hypothetical protein